MAKKLDWGKASSASKMSNRGVQVHEDFLPRGPGLKSGVKPKKQGSKLTGKKQLQQMQKQRQYINRSKNGYHELIDFIAESVARQEWISEMVPPTTSQTLAIEIKKAGGLVSWANKQSSYKKILNGKKRRLTNSQNHSN